MAAGKAKLEDTACLPPGFGDAMASMRPLIKSKTSRSKTRRLPLQPGSGADGVAGGSALKDAEFQQAEDLPSGSSRSSIS